MIRSRERHDGHRGNDQYVSTQTSGLPPYRESQRKQASASVERSLGEWVYRHPESQRKARDQHGCPTSEIRPPYLASCAMEEHQSGADEQHISDLPRPV